MAMIGKSMRMIVRKKAFAFLLYLFVLGALSGMSFGASPIRALDVDGDGIILNQKGKVTVVMYSNHATSEETTAAGKAVYPWHGKEDFRVCVVVDLRGSLALLVKGYAKRRIQRSLDAEAEVIRPYYHKNNNLGDPREHLTAFADMKGEICQSLGWDKKSDVFRAIIFGRDGKEFKRWDHLKDLQELKDAVDSALKR